MTSTKEATEDAEKPILKVSSSDVLAARLLVLTRSKLGEPVPDWVQKVADAKPASRRPPREE